MKICIIRHGETDWNVIRRLQGREDIPLNRNGLLQAERCGRFLRGGEWDIIVSSPLSRARQTAECIARALDIMEIHENPDFTERDYGKASGLNVSELSTDHSEAGIEKWETLRDRVYGALLKTVVDYPSKNIIIVSHGGSINALLAKLSNHEIGSGKTELLNTCLNMLEYSGGEFQIVYYNKQAEEV